MGILSEDVIIRLLVDTQKGVNDLKKADQQTQSLMKSALKMASAMGGAALATELLVKAGNALISYLKDAEKAYVDSIKAQSDYVKGTHSEIDAIDDLAAAKQHMAEVRGREIAKALEEYRARRAANLELKASFIDVATETQKLEASMITGIGALKEYKQAVVAAAEAGKMHALTLQEQVRALDALALRSKALNDFYGAQGLTTTTKDLTEQLKALKAQFGLMSDEEYINYQASQQLLALDKLIADQTEENTVLMADAGYTYRDVALSILEHRDAQLELLNTMDKTIQKAPVVASALDLAFGPDVTQQRISGFNALGSALTGFLSTAFGESKEAASVMAVINGALAITNVLANIVAPFNFIAAGLVAAQTAVEIAKINNANFANGTPPGGYVVPPGFEGDNYPVMAKSGETVNISRAGEGNTGMTQISIVLDSSVIARVTTNLIANRQIVIRQSDLVGA